MDIKAPKLISKSPAERMFVMVSEASMHMLSKKDLSSEEMDTLRICRTVVVTANGKVQTNEQAQIYVHDLDSFYSMTRQQFHRLENSPQNTDILMSGSAVNSHN